MSCLSTACINHAVPFCSILYPTLDLIAEQGINIGRRIAPSNHQPQTHRLRTAPLMHQRNIGRRNISVNSSRNSRTEDSSMNSSRKYRSDNRSLDSAVKGNRKENSSINPSAKCTRDREQNPQKLEKLILAIRERKNFFRA